MDRNNVIRPAIDVFLGVALRKESVDRNARLLALSWAVSASLSARRAWIEILVFCPTSLYNLPSLSARRAWIEISAP